MKKNSGIRMLFIISAIYDGLLGVLFLFAATAVFQWFHVTPPNHPGYIQLPAALLIVFALMFIEISRDPFAKRNLIIYGILLKVSYSGVVFFHWLTAEIPDMWKPFAVLDILFLVLFVWAYRSLGRNPNAS